MRAYFLMFVLFLSHAVYEPDIPFQDHHYRNEDDGGDTDELNLSTRLLLARLPTHSFHATCKFYKAIVARQFPPVCFFKASRMSVFNLGNLGYSHVLIYLMHAFVSTIQV